ncbi:hypothetical protein [Ascidiaceihabitans sp.]|uniref:hypothetical protein n=1 Tax=Ascidiaceihabitans sp. TaxID=1872644 RepID=UPI00329A0EB0
MASHKQLVEQATALGLEVKNGMTKAQLNELIAAHTDAGGKPAPQPPAQQSPKKPQDDMIETTALSRVIGDDGPVKAGDPIRLSHADYAALVKCGAVEELPDENDA